MITAEMVDNHHIVVSEGGQVIDKIIVMPVPAPFVELAKCDLLIELPESSDRYGDEMPYLFHVLTTADKMVKVCNAKDFESAYLCAKEQMPDASFLRVMIEPPSK